MAREKKDGALVDKGIGRKLLSDGIAPKSRTAHAAAADAMDGAGRKLTKAELEDSRRNPIAHADERGF